ncbi:MAG: hypothetical protein ACI9G1_000490 [Pirellulaceae bacterium]|jgi:hypothetical protein
MLHNRRCTRHWLAMIITFIGTCGFLTTLASPTRAAENGKRLNILFIYTDDHSHRTVSCYPESYPFVKTPNIDGLASQGMRFCYAYIGTSTFAHSSQESSKSFMI